MPDDFVFIESYPTPHDAHLAANALRAAGIDVRMTDEATVGALPHLELALGGIKLFVREADAEDAVLILRGEPQEQDSDSAKAASDERWPGPRSDEETAKRAFHAAVVGILICPILLHAYSISLLLRIPSTSTPLSRRARRSARWAWLLNVAVLAAGAIGVVQLLSR